MTYRVEVTRRAKLDLTRISAYIETETSRAAAAWLAGLQLAIASLHTLPERNPSIPEQAGFRHLLYGSRPHFYRVIYRIDDAERRVLILTIRHGAQAPLQVP